MCGQYKRIQALDDDAVLLPNAQIHLARLARHRWKMGKMRSMGPLVSLHYTWL